MMVLMNTDTKHYLTIGILAHVDAGKTTLSEAILYAAGAIRRIGRVDHGDAFLDTYAVEKDRGITVYSKPARFPLGDTQVTLLDTPGHADFSPEMERTLSVLDYGILLISAPEGIGSRVRLLWRLLRHYRVPTLLFVNKMDQPGSDRDRILADIRSSLSDAAVDLTDGTDAADVQEEIAMTDEVLMERFLSGTSVNDDDIAELITAGKLCPVYFGSALKQEGVQELIDGMTRLLRPTAYPEDFGARIYKITREQNRDRFSWMKITGGRIAVRDRIPEDSEDKVTAIRIYSGSRYESVTEAYAGQICAVQGLSGTYAGMGLGRELDREGQLLTPIIRRSVILPPDTDVSHTFHLLKDIEEEEPMLRLEYIEETREIFAQIMGEVQIDILRGLIRDRLGLEVRFGDGQIIYRETIRRSVSGAGHFEPLRHYAEVHVALSPGEPGSGITVTSTCPHDLLSTSWQRLAMSNLMSKRHKGILTGSDLTDVHITLIGGKAHLKHTEGGDFRKASIRAVRQALMKAENILLEPVYEFRVELPMSSLGMVMTDVEKMSGHPEPPEYEGDRAVITGIVPVSEWGDYALKVRAATAGDGVATVVPAGYRPCHNTLAVLEERGYDPASDLKNPTSSVFCSHGSGVTVPWDEAEARMHVETDWQPDPNERIPYPDAEAWGPGHTLRP